MKKTLIIPTTLVLAALAAGCSYQEAPSPAPTTTTTTTTYSTGEVVTTLPTGYRTVTVGGDRYYTYGNTYYRQQGGQYMIVDSPYGTAAEVSVIRELPGRYEIVNRGTDRYYRVGGTYYEQRSGGYVVVPGPF